MFHYTTYNPASFEQRSRARDATTVAPNGPHTDSGVIGDAHGLGGDACGLGNARIASVSHCRSPCSEKSKEKNTTRNETMQGKSFKTCAECGLMARSNNQHKCPPPSKGGCGAYKKWVNSTTKPRSGSEKKRKRTAKQPKQASSKQSGKRLKLNDDELTKLFRDSDDEFMKFLEDVSESAKATKVNAVPNLTRTPSLVPLDQVDPNTYVDSPVEIFLKAEITEKDNKIKELNKQMKKLQDEADKQNKKIEQLEAESIRRESNLKLREVALKRREIDLAKESANLANRTAIADEEMKSMTDRKIELEWFDADLRKREADVNLCEVHASDEMHDLMNEALNDFPVDDTFNEDGIVFDFF